MLRLLKQNLLQRITPLNPIYPQTNLSPFTHSFTSASSKPQQPLLDFFHAYGFTDAQIKNRLHMSSAIHSTETMKPKLDHLLAFGFSPSELIRIISLYPRILTASLKKHIEPNLKILETKFGSKTDIIKAIIRGPWLLTRNLEKNTIPNINILRENRIPTDTNSRLFMRSPLTLDKDCNVITESVNKLKGLGMSLSKLAFVHGMSVMATYKKETWERKLELYRSFGWSEKDTLLVFSRQPNCLGLSDDKFKKKMKFFKEKLWWDSALVAWRAE